MSIFYIYVGDAMEFDRLYKIDGLLKRLRIMINLFC